MSSPNGLSDHILIIGDESKSACAIQRLVVAAGYSASAIDSFDQALELLESENISLVIIEPAASRIINTTLKPQECDSGESLRRIEWAQRALSFCEEIRTRTTNVELPVLVISKSQRAHEKVAFLNRGATDFISKPYQRVELLSRIKSHLRAYRYDRERKERFEQLNVLHAVSSVLASSLEPDVLVSGTLSVLVNHLHVDAGVVFLRCADAQAISVAAYEGFDASHEDVNHLLDIYSRTAPLMKGEPLVLESLPESDGQEPACNVLKDVSGVVCAPLGFKATSIGAICLFSNRQTSFPRQNAE